MRNKRSLTPFGRRVRKRMIDLDIRHEQLCEQIGCSQSYLTDILAGRRSGGKYIDAICQALKFSEIPLRKEA